MTHLDAPSLIARAREIVAEGAEIASYWPQNEYGHHNPMSRYRKHLCEPYNWVLRRTDPVKEPDAIGAALVLTDGHPAHPDRPEFRLVTLRYVTYSYVYGVLWSPGETITLLRSTQISLLNLNNPEHLRLIWDVIGKS